MIGNIIVSNLSGIGGKSGGRGVRVYVGRGGRSEVLKVILEVAMVECKSKSLALGSLVDEHDQLGEVGPAANASSKQNRCRKKKRSREYGNYKWLYIFVLPIETWLMKEW